MNRGIPASQTAVGRESSAATLGSCQTMDPLVDFQAILELDAFPTFSPGRASCWSGCAGD